LQHSHPLEENSMPLIAGQNRYSQLNPAKAGPLFMLLAALLFTIMSVIVKLMPSQYSVWHLGFIRCFGGMVVLLSFFGRKSNPYRGNNIPLLIIRGCTGSIAFVTIVTALRILPISTASVIFYSFPGFAAMFAFIIYRERISIRQMGCIALLLVGVAVLFDFRLTGNLFGQIMAVVGGFFAGLTVTLIRSLREKNGPVIIYLYFCTMGTLITLPKFILEPIVPSTGLEWIMITGIILISVSAQLLMNQGFFYCKGWEGAVYMSSETIFTAIVGILLLNDPISIRFFIGAILILCSGFILNWLKANEKK
jgi:drug/metabolite transporter (DMT)-like permease